MCSGGLRLNTNATSAQLEHTDTHTATMHGWEAQSALPLGWNPTMMGHPLFPGTMRKTGWRFPMTLEGVNVASLTDGHS